MAKTWSPPIKIKWQGKPRDYFQSGKYMIIDINCDDKTAKLCHDVFGRQSTQIIMRNKEEARAMYDLLHGASGKNKRMNKSITRVRRELQMEMKERDWIANE